MKSDALEGVERSGAAQIINDQLSSVLEEPASRHAIPCQNNVRT